MNRLDTYLATLKLHIKPCRTYHRKTKRPHKAVFHLHCPSPPPTLSSVRATLTRCQGCSITTILTPPLTRLKKKGRWISAPLDSLPSTITSICPLKLPHITSPLLHMWKGGTTRQLSMTQGKMRSHSNLSHHHAASYQVTPLLMRCFTVWHTIIRGNSLISRITINTLHQST